MADAEVRCPLRALVYNYFDEGARSEFWGVASRVPSLQATLPPSP